MWARRATRRPPSRRCVAVEGVAQRCQLPDQPIVLVLMFGIAGIGVEPHQQLLGHEVDVREAGQLVEDRPDVVAWPAGAQRILYGGYQPDLELVLAVQLVMTALDARLICSFGHGRDLPPGTPLEHALPSYTNAPVQWQPVGRRPGASLHVSRPRGGSK